MNLTCVFFGTVFSLAGVLFAMGKLPPDPKAWKTMTEAEKAQLRPLCRNIGEMILLSGLLFLLKGWIPGFRQHWFTAAMVIWFAVAGLDLFLMGKKSKR